METTDQPTELIKKASVLLEALPYIQRFKDSVFVVKYGGSFMDDPDPQVRAKVITDIAFLTQVGIKVVVVHGGGKAISRAMERAQLEPNFHKGYRVTDAASMKIVEHTLNTQINLEICEGLQSVGGRPISIHGNDVFRCQRLSKDENGEDLDIGFVGEITNVHVHKIKRALDQGYTPIISPVGLDHEGQAYNNNADVAASCVASALHARRLVYLSDVPGLLRNPKDPSSLISTLSVDQVPSLIADGTISAGMRPKVDSGVLALTNGVHRVHFIDGRLSHSLLLEIFTDKGIGTEILNVQQTHH